MGNVPTTSATTTISTKAIDEEDPGVVALLRVASQRASNTEEERKELSKMAKRLRMTKKKQLETPTSLSLSLLQTFVRLSTD